MKITKDDIKKIYLDHLKGIKINSNEICPYQESLELFFQPQTSSEKKKKIVDHLTKCAVCFQDFNILLELQREQDKFIYSTSIFKKISQLKKRENNATKDRPYQKSFLFINKNAYIRRYSALLIGISFLVLSIFFLYKNSIRFSYRLISTNQLTIIHPQKKQAVSFPITFKWHASKGVDFYVLEIYSTKLDLLWRSQNIYKTEFTLIKNTCSYLDSDERYFWTIIAFINNRKILESKLSDFILQ